MTAILEFLSDLWDVLTFRDLCLPADIFAIVLVIVVWLLILLFVTYVTYTIYRLVAYDYEVETFSAKVSKKEFEPEYWTYCCCGKAIVPVIHEAEYNVYFITPDGLEDVIDDKELYDWAIVGLRFKVTMRVGRDRSCNRQIQYWKVLQYRWR